MNKVIKFKWEDRTKLYFSSDWHVFHDPKWDNPIWKMRGYESASAAAIEKQNKINSRVGRDDVLFFLGDTFLNAKDEQCLEWLDGINCQNIHILFGNHESNTYRIYKELVKKKFGVEDAEVYPLRLKNTIFLGNYQEILVGKQKIVLSHFPFRVWNQMQRGAWSLSGHSHLSDIERRPEYPHHKALDVGWDYKNDVWSFEEIQEVMATKTIKIIDHHDSSTN